MAARKPKHTSTRDKKLARGRSRREALRGKEPDTDTCPLYRLLPPYKHYDEWFESADRPGDVLDHPAMQDDRLPQEARDLLNSLVTLGPRYKGKVPMAAVILDRQLAAGHVVVAAKGHPGKVTLVPVKDMVAALTSPDQVRRLNAQNPGPGIAEDGCADLDEEGAVASLHELHAQAVLVMDDNEVMHVAIPPQRQGDRWQLSGDSTEG